MRVVSLLLVLLLSAPALAGPDEARLRADLASDDPASVAWAAWRAAEADARSLAPAVARRLVDACADKALASARGNLFDAAIRLGALPPATEIGRLARVNSQATAMLVCRYATARPEIALVAFDAFRPRQEPWVAVGNMLAGRAPAGFAARLLDGLELARTIRVHDEEAEAGRRRPPSGNVCWSGIARRPSGYPPTVIYTLSFDKSGRVLSDGAHRVYALRTVHDEPKSLFGGIARGVPHRDACCLGWLRAMVPEAARRAPLLARGDVDLRYVGRQPFEREVARITREIHRRYWTWTEALVERGALSEAEARCMTPVVRFAVRDERADRRHPVPEPSVPAPKNPWIKHVHRPTY